MGTSPAEVQVKRDLQRQNMLDRVFESEERSEAKRNFKQQIRINRELEMEQSLRRAETDKAIRQEQYAQEERLASELERFKLDQLRDTKMRQQLRETRYKARIIFHSNFTNLAKGFRKVLIIFENIFNTSL